VLVFLSSMISRSWRARRARVISSWLPSSVSAAATAPSAVTGKSAAPAGSVLVPPVLVVVGAAGSVGSPVAASRTHEASALSSRAATSGLVSSSRTDSPCVRPRRS